MPTPELEPFIRSTIKSVWALELLLILAREPARSWQADELNRELRGSIGLVNEILRTFQQACLVTEIDGKAYRYTPATPELAHLVRQLEATYAARPLAIVKTILAAPNDKIQTFADAFKVKKD